MVMCPKCRQENADDAAYCARCSQPLAESAAASPHATNETGLLTGAEASFRFVDPLTGTHFPLLNSGQAIIGREDGAWRPDINLKVLTGETNQGVSRRHAMVEVKGSQVFLQDLNSTNGTMINGKAIVPNEAQLLNDGDAVMCGEVKLVFRTSY